MPTIWCITENVPCAHKNVYSTVFCQMFYIYLFNWFIVLFKSSIFLSAFCLVLSIRESCLWSLQIWCYKTVFLLSIMLGFASYILETLILDAHMFIIMIDLCNFLFWLNQENLSKYCKTVLYIHTFFSHSPTHILSVYENTFVLTL